MRSIVHRDVATGTLDLANRNQCNLPSDICHVDPPDPPRRHGRVLRVGRAARRSGAARASRSPSAAGRTGAASSPRPATRRARSASTRRCRWPGRCGSARRWSSCRPDFQRYRGRVATRCSRSSARSRRWSSRCRSTRRISTSPRTRGARRWRRAVARRLKERIRADTGLTASAGVAPNKFLAKIASGWKKPDGLTVISPERVEPFLQQLPVDALWGVGPVTAEQAARQRHRAARRRARRRSAAAARDGRQPRRLAAPARQRRGRSAGDAEPRREVVGLARAPIPRTSPTSRRSATRSPSMAAHADRLARAAGNCWRARSPSRCATTTSRPITRSHTALPTRDEGELTARAVRLLDKTEAGHAADPAARRQRAQFLRRPRHRRDTRSPALRRR